MHDKDEVVYEYIWKLKNKEGGKKYLLVYLTKLIDAQPNQLLQEQHEQYQADDTNTNEFILAFQQWSTWSRNHSSKNMIKTIYLNDKIKHVLESQQKCLLWANGER